MNGHAQALARLPGSANGLPRSGHRQVSPDPAVHARVRTARTVNRVGDFDQVTGPQRLANLQINLHPAQAGRYGEKRLLRRTAHPKAGARAIPSLGSASHVSTPRAKAAPDGLSNGTVIVCLVTTTGRDREFHSGVNRPGSSSSAMYFAYPSNSPCRTVRRRRYGCCRFRRTAIGTRAWWRTHAPTTGRLRPAHWPGKRHRCPVC